MRATHSFAGFSSPSHRQGFTLIELLLVVSILGILAALAIPQFSKANETALVTEAATSMKEIAKAAQRYYLEHNQWPADSSQRVFPPELEPYLLDTDFSRAPLDGWWDYEDWRGNNRRTSGGTLIGIALSLRGGKSDLYDEVDRLIDDGDLNTGVVQYYAPWGGCLMYLIAPE